MYTHHICYQKHHDKDKTGIKENVNYDEDCFCRTVVVVIISVIEVSVDHICSICIHRICCIVFNFETNHCLVAN